MTLIERVTSHAIPVGDCWEWKSAMVKNTPTIMWRGQAQTVRRVIAKEYLNRSLDKMLVTTVCRNPRCVKPEHLLVCTRKKLQALLSKEKRLTPGHVVRAKLSVAARRRARLTLEQAQEIRVAEGTQREIATQYGISQATVSAIKSGRIWREYDNQYFFLVK